MTRNALGRGLSALIREPESVTAPKPGVGAGLAGTAAQSALAASEILIQIDIDLIDPSPYQPRTRFQETALEELAQSIRSSGIIQPLLVRRRGARYQLIAGERRWRAAQRASLQRVPAVVKEVAEELALEMTLVENLQREDLNPVEQAKAFDRLISEFRLTQEQVAERTGKDRATIANAIRLLRLEETIQEMMEEGKLSAGHGRALLAIPEGQARISLAKRASKGGFSVRQLERMGARQSGTRTAPVIAGHDPNTKAALEELQRALGTRVNLRPKTGTRPGQLILEYYDDAQLQGLYERLLGH
jgi:ParB family chromosome partitioning protein